MVKIKKLLTSNYSTTFATNLVSLVCGLLNSIILARVLGPEGRGEVAVAMLWPAMLVSFGSFGLTESTFFFATQGEYALNEVYTVVLMLTLILILLTLPVAYLFLPLLLGAQSKWVVELSSGFLLLVPFGMLLGHHSSILRSKLFLNANNVLILIVPLGNLLLAVLMGSFGSLTVTSVLIGHVILSILATGWSLQYMIHQRLITGLKIRISLVRPMFSFGTRVYVGTLFTLANLRLDQLLLTFWALPRDIGNYMVAVKISSIGSVFSTVISTVIIPRIAQQRDIDSKIMKLRETFEWYWTLNIISKVLFGFCTPILLPILYGQEFSDALLPSEVLILASLFYDARSLLTSGIQILNFPWLASLSEIIASAITIVLLFTLLPTLGIMGASITSLIAYAASLLILIRLVNARFENAGISLTYVTISPVLKYFRRISN